MNIYRYLLSIYRPSATRPMPSRPGLSPDVIAPRPPAAAAAGTVPRDVSFARLVEEIDKLGAKTAATVALLLPGLDKKKWCQK